MPKLIKPNKNYPPFYSDKTPPDHIKPPLNDDPNFYLKRDKESYLSKLKSKPTGGSTLVEEQNGRKGIFIGGESHSPKGLRLSFHNKDHTKHNVEYFYTWSEVDEILKTETQITLF